MPQLEYTQEEVCYSFDISENELCKNFKRVKERMLDKGFFLEKYKVNNEVIYTVTTLEKEEEGYFDYNILADLQEGAFGILLVLSTIKYCAYSGSVQYFIEELLNIEYNQYSKQKLFDAIEYLQKEDYILYKEDQTAANRTHFVIALSQKMKQEFGFKTSLMIDSQAYAKKYRLKSFIPLLKVWLALLILYNRKIDIKYKQGRLIGEYDMHIEEDYSVKHDEVQKLTGLSKDKIRKMEKILSEEGIFLRMKPLVKREDAEDENGNKYTMFCCKGKRLQPNGNNYENNELKVKKITVIKK